MSEDLSHGPTSPLQFDIEQFGDRHPGLNPDLFLEPTRAAFALYHTSPASVRILSGGVERESVVRFKPPDPRTAATLERERFVEFGAILMAGLLLWELGGKRICSVTERGSGADYIVREVDGRDFWVLEVGGTDEQSIVAVRTKKLDQLSYSPFLTWSHCRGGIVAVTRFAPIAVSCLEFLPQRAPGV